MANKKISQLDSKASLSLGDLLAVGDPTTGSLYKTTITDLKTLTGAGVVSFNGRIGAIVPAEGDYTLTQLGDVIITTAANGNILKHNGSNWVNVPMYTGTVSQYVDGTGAYQTFPTLLSSDRLLTEVRNNTGATITKGTVVYLNGSSGTLPLIAKAQANAEATSTGTYGVVQNDISNNSNGYLVVTGNLSGLDTSSYSAGDILWLSPSTAGGYSTTKPSAPNHAVYVGIVTRSHPNQGTIEIKIQNGYELDELHNVAISSVANDQVLVYETSSTLWKNKSISTILGLTPISLGSLSASAPLSYNSSTGAFSISQASTSTNGYLSSTDWNTFNGKQAALGYTAADDSAVVHLSGNETIAGIKIFSGGLYATTYPIITQSGIALDNRLSGTAASNHTTLCGNVDGIQINLQSGVYNNLNFASTTVGNTYTLPNATGTIALLSNIPSLTGYVPYTGATGNVSLGLNELTANNINSTDLSGNILSSLTRNSSSGIGVLLLKSNSYNAWLQPVTTLSAQRTWTLPDASGTVALTSDIPSLTGYVPTSRTITINGTAYDLSADRSWTIAGGVTSFNTRTGAITLTSSDVTTALGFTPYNSTNPNGYTSNTGTVTSVSGTGTVSGLTLTGTVTASGSLTLGGTLSLTSGQVTGALGYTPYNSSNPSGYITGINSTMVTNALGYTPYNSSNPSGYITSSSLTWSNISGRPTAVSSFTNDSGYITSGGRAYPRRSDGGDLNFYWSGQSGQPPWLWGGSDGANMYVYNPSNFSVNYASSAGNADTVDGWHRDDLRAWGNQTGRPGNIAYYDSWYGSSYLGSNGDHYLGWAGQWLSTALTSKVPQNADGIYTIGAGTGDGGFILYGSNYGAGYAAKIFASNGDGNTYFQQRNGQSYFSDVFYMAYTGMYCVYYGSWSDIRLKNVIETNPVIDVADIDVIKYTLKEENRSHIIRYGYSAQQVKSIVPDMWVGDNPDQLSLNYADVHTLKISALERKIKDLQNQLNSLKK